MRRMRTRLASGVAACAVVWALASIASPAPTLAARQAPPFSAEDVFSFPFPSDLVSSSRAPRLAWAFNEQGRRNVWVAESPAFTARQLTPYAVDDGQELTSIALSPSGDWVVHVRGGDHGANWDDSAPVNPLGMPLPPPVQVSSVAFAGGEPRLIGEGDSPVISPGGDKVAFERDRHLWLAPIDGSKPPTRRGSQRALQSDRKPGAAPGGQRRAVRGDCDSRRFAPLDAARQRAPRLQSGRRVVRTPAGRR